MHDYSLFAWHMELFSILLTIIFICTILILRVLDKWFTSYYCQSCKIKLEAIDDKYSRK